MAINNFIPAVWSARILSGLKKAQVYGALANRDYEGEIRDKGDTVKINSISDPTISSYTKGVDFASGPETLTGAGQDLQITEGRYFNFLVDDIDAAQQNPKVMSEAMQRAGYGLRDESDEFLAGLYTGVDAANIVGLGNDTTPVTPTKNDIYSYFITAWQRLTEANVPMEGRWAVVPPKHHALLLQAPEFIRSTAMGDSVITNGEVGQIAGFRVFVSNNVPNTTGTKYKLIFGYPGAITFAEQIVKTEAYRPEKRFADAVKGLYVYGAKLVRPTGIAVMTAN